ncbi:hypothetical protein Rin_00022540 [Candidatus Regiella insecticola 5.15]|uniref:Uncharacterized protein n=1 Tax=Candidatus Regiella insecticola 5.15 TaxID=1005043 RepID=G2H2F3_9ENTR|nr:hypothetical protein Rin_00022540 [Candidatus Regiella insecticola 5.15]
MWEDAGDSGCLSISSNRRDAVKQNAAIVIAIKSIIVSRDDSCAGIKGSALANIAPIQNMSGDFSTKGSPATCGISH